MPKIEDVPVVLDPKMNRQVKYAEFVDTLRDLKVGQSFVHERSPLPTTHRLAITIIERILERRFAIQKHKNGCRIGRIR